MLHKCGPSCYKYAQDGVRICRHQVYHLISFEPDTAEKPKRIRREGRALNNLVRITEEDAQGQRGRVELIREHPTETTSNYVGAVCLRCNLDAQTLVRIPPLSVCDSGPLPTIGSKQSWANMNAVVPDGAPTNLVLPLSDSDSEVTPSDDNDLSELTAEIDRETRCLFQDAHNAGFYINEYTTKVNVLGDKLLQGLRRAAEKQRDQMHTAALEEFGKKTTRAQQALQMLRKMVHLIARLQVKSGAEMVFPMLFGHMSFSTHRTWEVNVRRPVALLWKSWEAEHGKSLQRLRHSATFRHTLNMYLPQERDQKLPPDWLLLEVPSDTLHEGPKTVYLSPRGARFESYDTALHFIATSKQSTSAPVIFDPTKTTLDGDSDEVCKPDMTLTSASYFDDWLHRGSGNLLSDLPWYVYALWVYRTERLSATDPRCGVYLDIDFAPEYKLAVAHVQRISLSLRVPQPEGMTLPTALQDPNCNAMYKSLLFKPFHAVPMDPTTGETPDPFLCLHKSDKSELSNPYMSFSTQWHHYWRGVVTPSAARAREKLKQRLEWESLWETKEVIVNLLELSRKGPFADASLTLDIARSAAFAHSLVKDRITVQEYACLIVHRSAQNYESVALARVAPKVRRDALARDAEEDAGIRRESTEHDGGDFECADDGCFDDCDAEKGNCPDKPVDELTEERWKKAWQFTRERTSKFVKDLFECGLLRDIQAKTQLPLRVPTWVSSARVSLQKKHALLLQLPTVSSHPEFHQRIAEQYEEFQQRNTKMSRRVSPPLVETPSATKPGKDADARFAIQETPITKLKFLIAHVERLVQPGEDRTKVTLTREQILACATFGKMVNIAWEEERAQVSLEKRTCQQMILLGQGGTGKTMLVTDIFVPLVNWAFPPTDEGERWLVVAYSHAQANAISTEQIRARTLHNACSMRVQSLANAKMAPGAKKQALISTWSNKVLLVNEEVSMMPAEALNMEMYRAMWGRREQFGVNVDEYAQQCTLFGRMPLVVFLGDFLQLKPPKQISLADDLFEKARQGSVVSVEAQTACEAFRGVNTVIELLETRRFEDKVLPKVMNFIREADDTCMPEEMWQSLLSRSVEKNQAQLEDDLFANGHLVGIFWETIARCIVERATRDAKHLDVPLIFCRACDKRPAHQRWGSKSQTERNLVHQLLTTPNIHNTGHLHGILPLHEGMRIRLTTKLSADDGLVNERTGTVMKIDLRESDAAKVPGHFSRIQLDYMPYGVWVFFDKFHSAPLETFTSGCVAADGDPDGAIDFCGLVYIQLEKADFNLPLHLPDGSLESIHVTRWNLPLTHAMVRTAMSSQGLTFKKGVIADLRRAGGMTNDIWWLNVYVMLSRAKKLENLILVGLTAKVKELFEAGPPAYIRQQIKALQAKAARTKLSVEQTARDMGLHVPDAPAARN